MWKARRIQREEKLRNEDPRKFNDVIIDVPQSVAYHEPDGPSGDT